MITYSALKGESVNLICGRNLKSNPSPIIRWTNPKGEPVTSSGRFSMINGPAEVSVEIADVGRDDNGTWTCNVEVPRNNLLHCNSDSEQERFKELQLQLIVVSKLRVEYIYIYIIMCKDSQLSSYQLLPVNHKICVWRK